MGQPGAFIGATLACIIWAVTGPIFRYSDTWQLVINTATTVLTFLAVFLIQNSQNRDGVAIQAKLDEIIIAVKEARSGLVGIEKLTDDELVSLKNALEREAHGIAASSDDEQTVDDLLENRAPQVSN
jgi:low affinity Fe/Cu permease